MIRSAYATYQTTQAQTADRGQLLIMLYEGALKFLNQATAALAADDAPGAHTALIRAQDIVLELSTTLDESAGPLAGQLAAIYDYLYRRLVETNCAKDPAGVAEVSELLRQLLEVWREVVRQSSAPARPVLDRALAGLPAR